jgi:ribosome-associated protein
LRRNALKEAEQGKPPRAYRELFRELRDLEGKVDTEDEAD